MPLLLAILAAAVPELVQAALAAVGKGAPAQAESPVPDRIKAIVVPAVNAMFDALEPHFPDWVRPSLEEAKVPIEDAIEQECVKLNL